MSEVRGAGQDWHPLADSDVLQARAQLLSDIRQFFSDRDVLEVETPLLCQGTITDPNIAPLASGDRWLQTSPEYAMKRMLAAGSGPIYQVCKAFRASEAGSRHNPEFTLLEWYRPGFTLVDLMQEVESLVGAVLGLKDSLRFSYRELFQHTLSIDPFLASEEALAAYANAHIDLGFNEADRDTWLDLLLTHCIEPKLAGQGMVFVSGYPASQAALARTTERDGIAVAERFELYVDGVELANGYFELTDALEQARRFDRDNAVNAAAGCEARAPDQRLLQALVHGMPECSGVALGLDRLLMMKLGESDIRKVLSFPWDVA